MKTLGKSITEKFFKSPEDYLRLRESWAKRIQSREEIPFEEHVLYCMLIGKDWTAGCTVASEKKLRCGHPNAILKALDLIRSATFRHSKYNIEFFPEFAPFLSKEAPTALETLLPTLQEARDCVKRNEKIQSYKEPAQAEAEV